MRRGTRIAGLRAAQDFGVLAPGAARLASLLRGGGLVLRLVTFLITNNYILDVNT
ncbi:hypothetical protein [Streptomyces violascens]|uniref:hypothetical protein n=1 Tax=Streptomyces violascens TaxID=67381 RepID=UPI0036B7B0AA